MKKFVFECFSCQEEIDSASFKDHIKICVNKNTFNYFGDKEFFVLKSEYDALKVKYKILESNFTIYKSFSDKKRIRTNSSYINIESDDERMTTSIPTITTTLTIPPTPTTSTIPPPIPTTPVPIPIPKPKPKPNGKVSYPGYIVDDKPEYGQNSIKRITSENDDYCYFCNDYEYVINGEIYNTLETPRFRLCEKGQRPVKKELRLEVYFKTGQFEKYYNFCKVTHLCETKTIQLVRQIFGWNIDNDGKKFPVLNGIQKKCFGCGKTSSTDLRMKHSGLSDQFSKFFCCVGCFFTYCKLKTGNQILEDEYKAQVKKYVTSPTKGTKDDHSNDDADDPDDIDGVDGVDSEDEEYTSEDEEYAGEDEE